MITVFGIEAKLNLIDMQELGTLKELVFTCTTETAERVIKEAVKRGFPFQRISTGVKVYN